jgi:hypothetical protein
VTRANASCIGILKVVPVGIIPGALLTFALCVEAKAQSSQSQGIVGSSLRANADGVLGLLGWSVIPGSAASSIQVNRGSTGNPSINLGQLGSGFTFSDSFPLYLEGYLGYGRYDPKFVFSDGQEQRQIPARWNSLATTVGVGWDFHLSDHWIMRPIINLMAGYVASDARLAGALLNRKTNIDLQFLSKGHLNTAGGGVSLVFGYYLDRDAYDFDLELRSTNLFQTTWGDTSPAVRGRASSISTSLWTRLRWPTGMEMFGRPVRYVLEASHSTFYGDQARSLGFNLLTSIGAGLEVDPSDLKIGALGLYAGRVRVIGRYFFGPQVSGAAIGLGITF